MMNFEKKNWQQAKEGHHADEDTFNYIGDQNNMENIAHLAWVQRQIW